MRKSYNVSKEQTGTIVLVAGGDDYKDYQDHPVVKNVPKRDVFEDYNIKGSTYKWPRRSLQHDNDLLTTRVTTPTSTTGHAFKWPKRSVTVDKYDGLFEDDSEAELSGSEVTTGIWQSFNWPGQKNEHEEEVSTEESEGTTGIWQGFHWPESLTESGKGISGIWQDFKWPKAHVEHGNTFTSTSSGLPESRDGIDSNSERTTAVWQGFSFNWPKAYSEHDNEFTSTGIWQGFNWPEAHSEHENEFTSADKWYDFSLPRSSVGFESNSAEEITGIWQAFSWPENHLNTVASNVGIESISEEVTLQDFSWFDRRTESKPNNVGIESNSEEVTFEDLSWLNSRPETEANNIGIEFNSEKITLQDFSWSERHPESEASTVASNAGIESNSEEIAVQDLRRTENLNNEDVISNSKGITGAWLGSNGTLGAETHGNKTKSFLARILEHHDKLSDVETNTKPYLHHNWKIFTEEEISSLGHNGDGNGTEKNDNSAKTTPSVDYRQSEGHTENELMTESYVKDTKVASTVTNSTGTTKLGEYFGSDVKLSTGSDEDSSRRAFLANLSKSKAKLSSPEEPTPTTPEAFIDHPKESTSTPRTGAETSHGQQEETKSSRTQTVSGNTEASTSNLSVSPGDFQTSQNHTETEPYRTTLSDRTTYGFWQHLLDETTMEQILPKTTGENNQQHNENKINSSLEQVTSNIDEVFAESHRSLLPHKYGENQTQNIQPITELSNSVSHSGEIVTDKYSEVDKTHVLSHMDNFSEVGTPTGAEENVVTKGSQSSLGEPESPGVTEKQNIEMFKISVDNHEELSTENVLRGDGFGGLESTAQYESVASRYDLNLFNGNEDNSNDEDFKQSLSSLLTEVNEIMENLHKSESQVDENEDTLHADGSEHDINMIDDLSQNTNNKQNINHGLTNLHANEDYSDALDDNSDIDDEEGFATENLEDNLNSMLAEVTSDMQELINFEEQVTLGRKDFLQKAENDEASNNYKTSNNDDNDTDIISTTLSYEEEHLNSMVVSMDDMMQELSSIEEQITTEESEDMSYYSGGGVDNKNEDKEGDINSLTDASEEQSTENVILSQLEDILQELNRIEEANTKPEEVAVTTSDYVHNVQINTLPNIFSVPGDNGGSHLSEAVLDSGLNVEHTTSAFLSEVDEIVQKLSSDQDEINTMSGFLSHSSDHKGHDEKTAVDSGTSFVGTSTIDQTGVDEEINVIPSVLNSMENTNQDNQEGRTFQVAETEVERHTENAGGENNEHHTGSDVVHHSEIEKGGGNYHTESHSDKFEHHTESGGAETEEHHMENSNHANTTDDFLSDIDVIAQKLSSVIEKEINTEPSDLHDNIENSNGDDISNEPGGKYHTVYGGTTEEYNTSIEGTATSKRYTESDVVESGVGTASVEGKYTENVGGENNEHHTGSDLVHHSEIEKGGGNYHTESHSDKFEHHTESGGAETEEHHMKSSNHANTTDDFLSDIDVIAQKLSSVIEKEINTEPSVLHDNIENSSGNDISNEPGGKYHTVYGGLTEEYNTSIEGTAISKRYTESDVVESGVGTASVEGKYHTENVGGENNEHHTGNDVVHHSIEDKFEHHTESEGAETKEHQMKSLNHANTTDDFLSDIDVIAQKLSSVIEKEIITESSVLHDNIENSKGNDISNEPEGKYHKVYGGTTEEYNTNIEGTATSKHYTESDVVGSGVRTASVEGKYHTENASTTVEGKDQTESEGAEVKGSRTESSQGENEGFEVEGKHASEVEHHTESAQDKPHHTEKEHTKGENRTDIGSSVANQDNHTKSEYVETEEPHTTSTDIESVYQSEQTSSKFKAEHHSESGVVDEENNTESAEDKGEHHSEIEKGEEDFPTESQSDKAEQENDIENTWAETTLHHTESGVEAGVEYDAGSAGGIVEGEYHTESESAEAEEHQVKSSMHHEGTTNGFLADIADVAQKLSSVDEEMNVSVLQDITENSNENDIYNEPEGKYHTVYGDTTEEHEHDTESEVVESGVRTSSVESIHPTDSASAVVEGEDQTESEGAGVKGSHTETTHGENKEFEVEGNHASEVEHHTESAQDRPHHTENESTEEEYRTDIEGSEANEDNHTKSEYVETEKPHTTSADIESVRLSEQTSSKFETEHHTENGDVDEEHNTESEGDEGEHHSENEKGEGDFHTEIQSDEAEQEHDIGSTRAETTLHHTESGVEAGVELDTGSVGGIVEGEYHTENEDAEAEEQVKSSMHHEDTTNDFLSEIADVAQKLSSVDEEMNTVSVLHDITGNSNANVIYNEVGGTYHSVYGDTTEEHDTESEVVESGVRTASVEGKHHTESASAVVEGEDQTESEGAEVKASRTESAHGENKGFEVEGKHASEVEHHTESAQDKPHRTENKSTEGEYRTDFEGSEANEDNNTESEYVETEEPHTAGADIESVRQSERTSFEAEHYTENGDVDVEHNTKSEEDEGEHHSENEKEEGDFHTESQSDEAEQELDIDSTWAETTLHHTESGVEAGVEHDTGSVEGIVQGEYHTESEGAEAKEQVKSSMHHEDTTNGFLSEIADVAQKLSSVDDEMNTVSVLHDITENSNENDIYNEPGGKYHTGYGDTTEEHDTESEVIKSGVRTASVEGKHPTDSASAVVEGEDQTESEGAEVEESHAESTQSENERKHGSEVERHTESAKGKPQHTENEGTEGEYRSDNEGSEANEDNHTKSEYVETEEPHITGEDIESVHQSERTSSKFEAEHHSESGDVDGGHNTESAEDEGEYHSENEKGNGDFHTESQNDKAEQEHDIENTWAESKLHHTESGVEAEVEHSTGNAGGIVEKEYHTDSEGAEAEEHQLKSSFHHEGTTNDFLSEIADVAKKLNSVEEEMNTVSVLHDISENSAENNIYNESEGTWRNLEQYTESQGNVKIEGQIDSKSEFLSGKGGNGNDNKLTESGQRRSTDLYPKLTKKLKKRSTYPQVKKTEPQTEQINVSQEGNENEFVDFPNHKASTLCHLCEEAEEEQAEPIEEDAVLPSFPSNHETSTVCQLCEEAEEESPGKAYSKKPHGKVTKFQQRLTKEPGHERHNNKKLSTHRFVDVTSNNDLLHHKKATKTSKNTKENEETTTLASRHPSSEYKKGFEEEQRSELNFLATLTEQQRSTKATTVALNFKHLTKSQHTSLQEQTNGKVNEHYTSHGETKLYAKTTEMPQLSFEGESGGGEKDEQPNNEDEEKKNDEQHTETQIEHEGIINQEEEHNTENVNTEAEEPHMKSKSGENIEELKEHGRKSSSSEAQMQTETEENEAEHYEDQIEHEEATHHLEEQNEENTESGTAKVEEHKKNKDMDKHDEQITRHEEEQTEHSTESEVYENEERHTGSGKAEGRYTESEDEQEGITNHHKEDEEQREYGTGTNDEQNRTEEKEKSKSGEFHHKTHEHGKHSTSHEEEQKQPTTESEAYQAEQKGMEHVKHDEQITRHEEEQIEHTTESGVYENEERHTGSGEAEEHYTESVDEQEGITNHHKEDEEQREYGTGTNDEQNRTEEKEKSKSGEFHHKTHEHGKHSTSHEEEQKQPTTESEAYQAEQKGMEHVKHDEQITRHEEEQIEHTTESGVYENEERHTGSGEAEEHYTESVDEQEGITNHHKEDEEQREYGTGTNDEQNRTEEKEKSKSGEFHHEAHEHGKHSTSHEEEQKQPTTESEASQAEHNPRHSVAEGDKQGKEIEGIELKKNKIHENHEEGNVEHEQTTHLETENKDLTGSFGTEAEDRKTEGGGIAENIEHHENQIEHGGIKNHHEEEQREHSTKSNEEQNITEEQEEENKNGEHPKKGHIEHEEQISRHEENNSTENWTNKAEHNNTDYEGDETENELRNGSTKAEEQSTESGSAATKKHKEKENENKKAEYHKAQNKHKKIETHNEEEQKEHYTEGGATGAAEEHTENKDSKTKEQNGNEGESNSHANGEEELQGLVTERNKAQSTQTKENIISEYHQEDHEHEEKITEKQEQNTSEAESNTGNGGVEEHTNSEGNERKGTKVVEPYKNGADKVQKTGHEEEQKEHITENVHTEGKYTGSIGAETGEQQNTKSRGGETKEHNGKEGITNYHEKQVQEEQRKHTTEINEEESTTEIHHTEVLESETEEYQMKSSKHDHSTNEFVSEIDDILQKLNSIIVAQQISTAPSILQDENDINNEHEGTYQTVYEASEREHNTPVEPTEASEHYTKNKSVEPRERTASVSGEHHTESANVKVEGEYRTENEGTEVERSHTGTGGNENEEHHTESGVAESEGSLHTEIKGVEAEEKHLTASESEHHTESVQGEHHSTENKGAEKENHTIIAGTEANKNNRTESKYVETDKTHTASIDIESVHHTERISSNIQAESESVEAGEHHTEKGEENYHTEIQTVEGEQETKNTRFGTERYHTESGVKVEAEQYTQSIEDVVGGELYTESGYAEAEKHHMKGSNQKVNTNNFLSDFDDIAQKLSSVIDKEINTESSLLNDTLEPEEEHTPYEDTASEYYTNIEGTGANGEHYTESEAIKSSVENKEHLTGSSVTESEGKSHSKIGGGKPEDKHLTASEGEHQTESVQGEHRNTENGGAEEHQTNIKSTEVNEEHHTESEIFAVEEPHTAKAGGVVEGEHHTESGGAEGEHHQLKNSSLEDSTIDFLSEIAVIAQKLSSVIDMMNTESGLLHDTFDNSSKNDVNNEHEGTYQTEYEGTESEHNTYLEAAKPTQHYTESEAVQPGERIASVEGEHHTESATALTEGDHHTKNAGAEAEGTHTETAGDEYKVHLTESSVAESEGRRPYSKLEEVEAETKRLTSSEGEHQTESVQGEHRNTENGGAEGEDQTNIEGTEVNERHHTKTSWAETKVDHTESGVEAGAEHYTEKAGGVVEGEHHTESGGVEGENRQIENSYHEDTTNYFLLEMAAIEQELSSVIEKEINTVLSVFDTFENSNETDINNETERKYQTEYGNTTGQHNTTIEATKATQHYTESEAVDHTESGSTIAEGDHHVDNEEVEGKGHLTASEGEHHTESAQGAHVHHIESTSSIVEAEHHAESGDIEGEHQTESGGAEVEGHQKASSMLGNTTNDFLSEIADIAQKLSSVINKEINTVPWILLEENTEYEGSTAEEHNANSEDEHHIERTSAIAEEEHQTEHGGDYQTTIERTEAKKEQHTKSGEVESDAHNTGTEVAQRTEITGGSPAEQHHRKSEGGEAEEHTENEGAETNEHKEEKNKLVEEHSKIPELYSISESGSSEDSLSSSTDNMSVSQWLSVEQAQSDNSGVEFEGTNTPVVEFELSLAPGEREENTGFEMHSSEINEKSTRGRNTNKVNFTSAFKFSTTMLLLMSSVYGHGSTAAASTTPKPRPSVYVDLPVFIPNTTESSTTCTETRKRPSDNEQCIVVYVNGPASLNGTKWNGHLENYDINGEIESSMNSQNTRDHEREAQTTTTTHNTEGGLSTPSVDHQTESDNEKLDLPKFLLFNKCDKTDFTEKKDCVCAVDDLVSSIKHKEFGEGADAKLECSRFLKLPNGIIIGSDSLAQIRKKRSFLFGKTCVPFKRETIDYSKGFFDEIFKIVNTEFDIYALPGTEVIIPCLNKNEVIEFNKYMQYSWLFDDSVHIPDSHIKQDEGNLLIERVSANDSGNYTCTVKSKISDEHSNPEQNYHHQLVVVSTPIYKIKTRIIYTLNQSCTLTDGDVINTYLPKIFTGMLCGFREKLCTVEILRPNCIPGPSEHLLNVTFVVTMRTLSNIIPTIDNTKCKINCQMHLYAKLAGVLVSNIEIIEKQPITSELNTKSLKLYPKKVEPHNKGKKGYWSGPPMLIITCPAGYGVEKAHPRVCVVCPKNTYSGGEESYCKMCQAGRYQPTPGSKSCLRCSSPLENAACLRALYSSTGYFKLYVGLAFGFLILTIIGLFYLGYKKPTEENAPVSKGANYVFRHGLRKTVNEEEGEPLLGDESIAPPPQVPPPDF